MAIGAITITATRELKVDFSKPFMDFKISLLMQKPTEEELNLFAFLLPFEIMVWLSTIAVVSLPGFKTALVLSWENRISVGHDCQMATNFSFQT